MQHATSEPKLFLFLEEVQRPSLNNNSPGKHTPRTGCKRTNVSPRHRQAERKECDIILGCRARRWADWGEGNCLAQQNIERLSLTDLLIRRTLNALFFGRSRLRR